MSKKTQLELIELPPPKPRIKAGDRVSYLHDGTWHIGTVQQLFPNGKAKLKGRRSRISAEDLRSPF